MTQLQSGGPVRIAQSLTVLLLGVTLAACTAPSGRARAVQEDAPSVTYEFSDDQGLVDATIKAEAYCRQYNSWPTNSGTRTSTDGTRKVTFVCDQARNVAFAGNRPPELPPNVTVQYTYHDERALIDATTQAQRHCAAYGAEARSQTVTTAPDGTRTIMFECIRVR